MILLIKAGSPSVSGESGVQMNLNNGSPQSFDSEEETLVQRSGISIIGMNDRMFFKTLKVKLSINCRNE